MHLEEQRDKSSDPKKHSSKSPYTTDRSFHAVKEKKRGKRQSAENIH
jgi:hypothetical protein